jgi:hypothetical protein
VAVDTNGNLYIADTGNGRIRKVAVDTGVITTVAGNGTPGYSGDGGPATSASLEGPNGVAVDANGNLFIADSGNHRIRKVAADTGVITTIAGNGTAGYSGDDALAASASLDASHVAVDSSGNLYVSDDGNNVIRRVAADIGVITTVVGNGSFGFSGDSGPATSASLNAPFGMALDSAGNLYIADSYNNRVRKVTAVASQVANGSQSRPGGVQLYSSCATIQPGSWLPCIARIWPAAQHNRTKTSRSR